MTPSTETWLISTISKRLERIAEGKEPMAEDRALTLLSILKDVAGDIPSLTNLPQHVKEWLEAAINARLDAIAEKREIAAEDRIATLTEALAALRPPASPGGSVERVDTGAGLSGGPITTTGTISLSTSSQQAIARANTSVQPEDLADVATSGNYADLTNTPDIPEQFNPIQGANMLITGTYPNITFSAVAGEEFTPVWGEIQGTLADQTDLQDALDGKAPTVHTHTWGQITGAPVYTTRWPSWSEVTGKPSTFPPSSHTHAAGDINSGTFANARISQSSVTQHQAALSIGWGQLTGLPAFATRWPTWNEVTGKPSIPDPDSFISQPGTTWWTPVDSSDSRGSIAFAFRAGGNVRYFGMGNDGTLRTSTSIQFSSGDLIWHSGNFDPDSKAPVANPVFEGDLTVSTSLASGGVIVERRNQPYNASIEYKTTAGSIWAGYGNNGTIGFSVGGSSNLTASNTWFKAQDGAAYVFQGSTPREVYHEGNLSVSEFVQQPGGSWWTDVTSTASQDSIALRFQTPSNTRYFGVGNDGTLRTSTSNQFSSGDLILTSGNTSPMSNNGVSHVSNDWDAINKTGVYHNTSSGATGTPTSNLWMTVWHSENGNGTASQIAQRVAGDMYWMRARNTNGVWSSWSLLWHSKNFDPSSKFDNPTGSTSQYIRGNGSLATFPSIPSSSDYVATSGNQGSLSGNKDWTGVHSWRTTSASPNITVERTNNTVNALFGATTNAGDVYFGHGASNTFCVGGSINQHTLSNNWLRVESAGTYINNNEAYHSGNLPSTSMGWTGNHTFTKTSNTQNFTIERTGSTARNVYVAYSTNATTIYAGIANVNDTTWGIGTSSNLTSDNTQFRFDTSTGNMSVSGAVTASGDIYSAGTVASGNALIRGTSAAALFSFEGTTTGSALYFRPRGTGSSTNQTVIDWNGNMTVGGNVTGTNITATSDPRLKTNKQRAVARRELIEKLEYWSFEWKKDGTKGRSVMADKVREIAPEHVHVADDEMGTLSVDKGALALEMVFAIIDVLKEQELVEGEE